MRDTPISETAFIGTAVGAASDGMRPIVELMFVDFFGVCMDAIYNLMAKNTYFSGGRVRVPMVLMTSTGGGYSDAGQHSQCLYATVPVPEDAYTMEIGKAEVVREGSDVTLVSLGAGAPQPARRPGTGDGALLRRGGGPTQPGAAGPRDGARFGGQNRPADRGGRGLPQLWRQRREYRQRSRSRGVARFTTLYPGWYSGRAVHIHFKIRTDPEAERGLEFTSQLYFDDALTDRVH